MYSMPQNVFRVLSIIMVLGIAAQASGEADWTQWGGPRRNFMVEAKGIATSWPAAGPRKIWSRPLGEGHSMVIVEGTRLYTMYSSGEKETVISLDAATGKTIWEHTNDAASTGMNYEFGKGPHSTPLIAGDFLFTIGAVGKMQCLNKNTGKPVWSRDLWSELKGTVDDRGYSCSPLAYKNLIIVTLGGNGQALVAFNQKDGAVVWKKHDFMTSPSSHMIINVGGQDQLVAFLGKEIVGLDPNNGDRLWSHTHETDWGLNISTPVWGEDNLLFLSSAYKGGSRVLRLTKQGDKTAVSELWFHRQMRVHHGTIVRIGDYVYGSNGDFGPSFFTAVNVKTGEVAWRDRSFPKTNFVYADGKFVILDEDGSLAIATVTPKGLTVHCKAQVLQNLAWTAPTLVGTRLYVRDRKTIAALELSQ
jgi:outer membrane protein assembly factor BamB